MSPSGPCYLPSTSWQAQFWESSIHLPLFINPSWCTFCPPVLFNCIVFAKVANGRHVTKQDGYLSILILLDHPCWSLWFLKSSFYFASALEKVMSPHSSILAWKIPWTKEPGRLQSMGSLRVGYDWATSLSLLCIGEGNGNPLQCSCLENPRDREAWWAAVHGVAQSRTRLKRLSSSSSSQSICKRA